MDIARLNVRVDLQRRKNASDAVGNRRSEWETVRSCFATVSSEGGRQEAQGGVAAADATEIAFTVRWCRAVEDVDNTGWRVLFGGRAWDVTGVDHMGFRRECVKLLCKRGDR